MPCLWTRENEKKETARLMSVKAWYQEIHFGIGKQQLWFHAYLPLEHPPCHHIDKLYCSWANRLKPEECETVIGCILLKHKEMFSAKGIAVEELKALDREIRQLQKEYEAKGKTYPPEPPR